MADYKSGLPIRSEKDLLDERVHVKVVDYTNPDSQQMEVDTDNNAHVEVHGNRCDGAADVAIELSEQGRPNGRGDYEVDDNSCPASSGLVAGIRAAGNVPTDQTEHVTSVEDSGGTVRALDVSLHDENGEAYSGSNPIPVTLEASEGTEVHDYDTAAAIVKDATDNHDYSVGSGDTFQLSQILASASGKMKVEIQIGDGAAVEVFTTKFVRFNSTANTQADLVLAQPLAVVGTANTTTIRVIRTNLDNQAQDLYSTIVGVTQ